MQNNMLKNNNHSLGIYIHVPFCKSRCIYCDFISSIDNCSQREKYVDYLCRQIDLSCKEYSDGYIVDTVYLGGGTPSLLDGNQLRKIGKHIFSHFKTNLKEFTSEVNPCTVDEQKLLALKEIGVTRLSIGVQSFNDKLLSMLGRQHNSHQAEEAICLAKKMGFDVSIDAMIGLPNQRFVDIENFIDNAKKFDVDHISVYMLSIEDGTRLKELINKGQLIAKSDDEVAQDYDFACERLKKNGYSRYEISNFCKDGKVSFHNLRYWQCKDYLGLGIGAHSLTRGERWRNCDSFDEYYSAIDSGYYKQDIQILTDKEKIQEFIMLSLRLKDGIDLLEFKKRFDIDFMSFYDKAIEKNLNYLSVDDCRVFIKEEFLQVMNSIIVDFLD